MKHWVGFPSYAINYCLSEVGATLSDVEDLAINTNPKAQFWRKARYALSAAAGGSLLRDRWRQLAKRLSLRQEIEQAELPGEFRGRISYVEHHQAHLASAFYASPFVEASVVSIDGFGDFSSTAWGRGYANQIDIQGRIHFPHSLGIFYQALTQYLGFLDYGDEYKVMGLAAYGRPAHAERLRQVVRLQDDGTFELDTRFFRHHKDRITVDWAEGVPCFEQLYSDDLELLLGAARKPGEPLGHRHYDVARSVQSVYEDAFFNLLAAIHEQHGLDAIALAGGCAMNSAANGKIARATPFRRVYVQAASGDAGGALGAALHVAKRQGVLRRTPIGTDRSNSHADSQCSRTVMDHAYWGPSASQENVEQVLQRAASELAKSDCTFELITSELDLCRAVARRLKSGDVVGWFQGRMEWGPRALGNRSIICDPRNPDIRELLNGKIKRRENFRPFAPAILREHVADWFEEDGDVPFMTQVNQVRIEKRSIIPAVTHVDGSGRLQTVSRATNHRFWQLIQCFNMLTGVPVVLNTSFNENEPIVCYPEEALDCFLRTRMDLLVLGNYIVTRKRSDHVDIKQAEL